MTAQQIPVEQIKVNINGQEYAMSDLPDNVQVILQDLMRMEQEIKDLQYRLRQLNAARQVYLSSLQQSVAEQSTSAAEAGSQTDGEVA
jgi:hypothetical protein